MEAGLILAAKIMLTLCLASLLVLLMQLYNVLVLKQRRLRRKLKSQGINGPSPSFLYGNIAEMKKIQAQIISSMASPTPEDHNGGVVVSHAWPARVFPHIEQWRYEYGPVFMYSTGSIQILCITDPEMVKEVSLCTTLNLGKPSYLSTERGPLLGQGILSSNGVYWARQRKIIAPEFYLDKVKDMVNLMVESTTKMLQSWESKAESPEENVEICIDEDMRALSADIISRACFGSSYAEGEKIFSKLRTLQKIMSKGNIGVPGLRHIPSKHNWEIWRLEKEIEAAILNVVQARTESNCEKDLLQVILEAGKSFEDDADLPEDINLKKFIVDNCKNIYFAGHETTAISTSWCLMLLAANPDWQARARAEVLEICGNNVPTAEMIRSVKTLTMVIQETLRLYPPVAFVVREALQDINIKGIQIPEGIDIQIPIPMLHQHTDLWGPDAYQFNPARFTEGVVRACRIPQAYMPFGVGTRTCVGQHFAMTELKVILSLILSRFSFSLAPSYDHRPAFRLVIEPGNGVTLNVKKL